MSNPHIAPFLFLGLAGLAIIIVHRLNKRD
jgi:hypothetical protein